MLTPEMREAREIAWDLEYEVRYTMHRLEKLYSAMYAGDTSEVTRTRVRRLEAVLSALQGFPEVLAG